VALRGHVSAWGNIFSMIVHTYIVLVVFDGPTYGHQIISTMAACSVSVEMTHNQVGPDYCMRMASGDAGTHPM
jgi:hypothetical protein